MEAFPVETAPFKYSFFLFLSLTIGPKLVSRLHTPVTSYQILRYFSTQGTQKLIGCYYTSMNILHPREGWSRTFREHSPFWSTLPAGGVTQTGINPSAKPFRKESSFTQFPLHLNGIPEKTYCREGSKDGVGRYSRSETLSHGSTAERLGKKENKNPALPFPQRWFLTSKRHNHDCPFTPGRKQFSNRLYKNTSSRKSENALAV